MNSSSTHILNLAAYIKDSKVAGPGNRDVIYFQGCSIHCPGCANFEFWPRKQRFLIATTVFLEHLSRRASLIDGITLSGGEPTEQASAAAEILKGARELGLSTVVFTGRQFEDLRIMSQECQRMLAYTDLLIDGPFMESKRNQSLQWRGSTNQRLLYLTDKLRSSENNNDSLNGEIIIDANEIRCHGVSSLPISHNFRVV